MPVAVTMVVPGCFRAQQTPHGKSATDHTKKTIIKYGKLQSTQNGVDVFMIALCERKVLSLSSLLVVGCIVFTLIQNIKGWCSVQHVKSEQWVHDGRFEFWLNLDFAIHGRVSD